ncbi:MULTISPECIES: ATP-binding protein [Desulfococcus]|jgi:tRNA 2-thiocytidine biosynthesis protein TtcA|uniref:PP-loop domain protein n=1 Tax=Desulfococcus multivorans DSM 2059 TaxID=1121405 RepID=S7VA23_DESML|nr:ATP-binding protein [Desulfococcus multivorans]AQV00457.1 tRNA 2-thiocytidine(32) synthetase TtcA [Desulfococcus multivorans]EPR41333.1 PP-loop domain protein [Desulfococcus multivorans DSM 2059]MDX9817560.1 ATP-binding protein [Desulfococcus multivorans]SJZ72570.1 tRNA 2-thiocytidine biosynthesis protein TtcA [Desulfococcus multivorans DSM 2059]
MLRHVHKTLRRSVGKALHRYDMIADGDRVLVGLSGGADSLTLMWCLKERLARVPIHYDLFAVYIDPGFEDGFSDDLIRYSDGMGYALRVEHTDFGPLSHSDVNLENPCFLCSRLRRKRLFEVARELGCRKLALGHNKDDIIETLFLNMCYAGEISTMLPVQPFFQGAFTVIRPLAFSDEEVIRRFAKEMAFPEFVNSCPSAATSRRAEIKAMLKTLYRSNRKIKGNIFRSMSHVKPDYLLQ